MQYTLGEDNRSVNQYSRHFVLNWNNTIQKFEIKGWLNSKGSVAVERDLLGLWRGSHMPISDKTFETVT